MLRIAARIRRGQPGPYGKNRGSGVRRILWEPLQATDAAFPVPATARRNGSYASYCGHTALTTAFHAPERPCPVKFGIYSCTARAFSSGTQTADNQDDWGSAIASSKEAAAKAKVAKKTKPKKPKQPKQPSAEEVALAKEEEAFKFEEKGFIKQLRKAESNKEIFAILMQYKDPVFIRRNARNIIERMVEKKDTLSAAKFALLPKVFMLTNNSYEHCQRDVENLIVVALDKVAGKVTPAELVQIMSTLEIFQLDAEEETLSEWLVQMQRLFLECRQSLTASQAIESLSSVDMLIQKNIDEDTGKPFRRKFKRYMSLFLPTVEGCGNFNSPDLVERAMRALKPLTSADDDCTNQLLEILIPKLAACTAPLSAHGLAASVESLSNFGSSAPAALVEVVCEHLARATEAPASLDLDALHTLSPDDPAVAALVHQLASMGTTNAAFTASMINSLARCQERTAFYSSLMQLFAERLRSVQETTFNAIDIDTILHLKSISTEREDLWELLNIVRERIEITHTDSALGNVGDVDISAVVSILRRLSALRTDDNHDMVMDFGYSVLEKLESLPIVPLTHIHSEMQASGKQDMLAGIFSDAVATVIYEKVNGGSLQGAEYVQGFLFTMRGQNWSLDENRVILRKLVKMIANINDMTVSETATFMNEVRYLPADLPETQTLMDLTSQHIERCKEPLSLSTISGILASIQHWSIKDARTLFVLTALAPQIVTADLETDDQGEDLDSRTDVWSLCHCLQSLEGRTSTSPEVASVLDSLTYRFTQVSNDGVSGKQMEAAFKGLHNMSVWDEPVHMMVQALTEKIEYSSGAMNAATVLHALQGMDPERPAVRQLYAALADKFSKSPTPVKDDKELGKLYRGFVNMRTASTDRLWKEVDALLDVALAVQWDKGVGSATHPFTLAQMLIGLSGFQASTRIDTIIDSYLSLLEKNVLSDDLEEALYPVSKQGVTYTEGDLLECAENIRMIEKLKLPLFITLRNDIRRRLVHIADKFTVVEEFDYCDTPLPAYEAYIADLAERAWDDMKGKYGRRIAVHNNTVMHGIRCPIAIVSESNDPNVYRKRIDLDVRISDETAEYPCNRKRVALRDLFLKDVCGVEIHRWSGEDLKSSQMVLEQTRYGTREFESLIVSEFVALADDIRPDKVAWKQWKKEDDRPDIRKPREGIDPPKEPLAPVTYKWDSKGTDGGGGEGGSGGAETEP